MEAASTSANVYQTTWRNNPEDSHLQRFFSLPQRSDRLWGPPSLLSNGYWGGGDTQELVIISSSFFLLFCFSSTSFCALICRIVFRFWSGYGTLSRHLLLQKWWIVHIYRRYAFVCWSIHTVSLRITSISVFLFAAVRRASCKWHWL
jgi:hypothetical protein